jgi:hypothetical protein
MTRFVALLIIALSTTSCSITREIRVAYRGNGLVIDFPWSFWRVLRPQTRHYPCIDRIELFDSEHVMWSLDAASPSGACVDAAMPIAIGQVRTGFIAKGRAVIRAGVEYGVSIQSYAPAHVDFIVEKVGRRTRNVTDWSKMIAPPCGTYFGSCAPGERSR